MLGNPARGDGAELTFGSQSAYVLPVAGRHDAFIFIADRWQPKNAIDGRYVWLPIVLEGENFTIPWRAAWDLSVFAPGTKPGDLKRRFGPHALTVCSGAESPDEESRAAADSVYNLERPSMHIRPVRGRALFQGTPGILVSSVLGGGERNP